MSRGRLIRWWRTAGWCGVIAVALVSLVPVPPETVEAAGGDKLIHLVGYAVLALWFGQLQPAGGLSRWRVAGWLALLGAGLEAAQYVVPWRSAEGWDLLADAAGAIIGVALAGWRAARVIDRAGERT